MTREPRRPGRPRRVARSGVLSLACLLAAGCTAVDPGTAGAGTADAGTADAGTADAGTADAGTATASTGAAVDLTAEMVRYRRDAQREVVQVKVTNHGGSDVRVERVEVRSPTFVAPASADKDSRVGAGLAVDLALPLAEPRCGGSDDGPDAHVVVLVVDGTTVELPVDDRVLQQVRGQRCAERAVGDLVAVAWQPGWEDAGVVDGEPALRGRLVLTPTSSTPVTVAVEGATTLFTVDERVEATLRGEPGALDVVVTVTRCDPHAVAEDKKGYLFPVRVRPEGGEEVLVEVAVPVPERAPLQDLIERTCY